MKFASTEGWPFSQAGVVWTFLVFFSWIYERFRSASSLGWLLKFV